MTDHADIDAPITISLKPSTIRLAVEAIRHHTRQGELLPTFATALNGAISEIDKAREDAMSQRAQAGHA